MRTQPFQVVLFDELDKAHANIWDLLLPLLDEGYLTSATGERVDFRSTLVVCTSNVGPPARRAQRRVRPARRIAAPGGLGYELRVREALETAFRPEFLNRFQSIALFHPLSVEDVRTIARQALRAIFARDGLARRRVTVEVDDAALDLAARFGFDARYGARALKRELQTHLVLPLARTLMERTVAARQRAPPAGARRPRARARRGHRRVPHVAARGDARARGRRSPSDPRRGDRVAGPP